ncbi:MAG: hydantoinase B/oxoprolinase family protein [Solirubrobacteraceae bacterium]
MATLENNVIAENWNEASDGYLAPQRISTTAPLHTESKLDIDPISYEVIRHALWNINIEHGETILKVSGSPIALYSHDFNPAITAEDGELVYFGQYVQHLCAGAPAGVKWTLEYRDVNPGIADGDIFLTNDPWISCNHQQDIVLLKPVFWEGAIFAWVTSTLHHYDLGGTTPGSFCPDAKDIYYEPSPIPPIKIVEGNVIRIDVEDMVLRKSRLPDLVKLDLHAMIAGCNVAERRMHGLCEKYEPAVVKGAMKKISDNSEQVFLARLRDIPDGVWRDRTYLEMALPGDREIYKFELSVTKEGDTLTFRNEGTDPQYGAINSTIVGFRGSIMTGLIGAFLHDQLFAYGGPMRHIKFEPTPGTLTCARYPAAVTCAPNTGMLVVLSQANAVISKMISCSANEADRREATAKFGGSQFPILSLAGTDQWGGQFATVLLDPMMSGIGAFSHRDGVSTGGYPFDPKAIAPNVEFNEQFFPILYLHRTELADSAGPGRFRGGASASWAVVPHGTEEINLATSASGVWVPTGNGMWGGGTATTNRFRIKSNTDLEERFAAREVPQFDELAGDTRYIEPKETGTVQHRGDVLEIQYPAAGGWGDPFEREPSRVAADVEEGFVSVEGARRDYGVVVTDDGDEVSVDATETERVRLAETDRRRREARPAVPSENTRVPRGSGRMGLGDAVTLELADGHATFRCAHCDAELGVDPPDYKTGAVVMDRPLTERVPGFVPGDSEAANQLVHREHYCPSCLVRLDAEVVRQDEASLVDVEIWAPPASIWEQA